MGRIERQGHVWYVPRRGIVQRRYFEVATFEREQHGEYVSKYKIFHTKALRAWLGQFKRNQNGNVCRVVRVNIEDRVHD